MHHQQAKVETIVYQFSGSRDGKNVDFIILI